MKSLYYSFFYYLYKMGFRVWKEGTWYSVSITISIILFLNVLTLLGIIGTYSSIKFIFLQNKYYTILIYIIIWILNLFLFGKNNKYKLILKKYDERNPDFVNYGILLSLIYSFLSFIIALIVLVNMPK
jgi:fumarate reductase subunit D